MIVLISAILRAISKKNLLGDFSWVFFSRAFLLSGSVLSSTLYVGLLCLLRMHAINSCVVTCDSDSDGMI